MNVNVTTSQAATTVCPAPVVEELGRGTDPERVFQALASLPHVIFLDSALSEGRLGRYSYVAADPCRWLTVRADASPALPILKKLLAPWSAQRVEGLPPWQGGAAGLLGYEMGRSLEHLPAAKWDEFQTPALAVGLFDCVVAYDHEQGKAWAISHGLPEQEPDDRQRRAEKRLEWLLGIIEDGASALKPKSLPTLARDRLAPQFETPGYDGLLSDFSREGYLAAVEQTIKKLRAGDAYQVNLSQRILAPDPGDSVALYLRMRRRNPAPFAAFLDGGSWQVASASPERFLQLANGVVETRPIKGTRPRGATDIEDQLLGEQLLSSEKDRAENVMIVDLLRNDLSRVCTETSVEVPELFALEKYARVQHLVSVVRGELAPEQNAIDLLAATMPGGSVTGAPKIRAQEIIAELEPTARGAYCGAMAWLGLQDEQGRQAMDSSVLIRTITRSHGWLQLPAGGGVVVQSEAEQEYEETWHKAAGLIESIHN